MKPLLDLTERCCRWPVGPNPPIGQTERQLWCGAPRAPGDLFCPEHMKRGCPGRKVRPTDVRARNLVTLKLVLMRRRTAAMPSESIAPKLGVISPNPGSKPTTTGLKGGAQLAQTCMADPANMDGCGHNMDGGPDALRSVQPLTIDNIALAEIPTDVPLVEWMAPADLLVDGRYQRDLSPRSLDLIKRIAERWDWRRFKPPIVAWTERGFEIIDGQHTAIGAATRGVEKIPVLVVEATDMSDRASAFVGHNQDRLPVTAIQMHQAKLAAGDEDALTAQQVIDKAGATLVLGAYGARGWKPGETVAITTIDGLSRRRGAMKARQVVEVLVKAEAAPVSAAAIKAVDMLMNMPAYDEIDLEHLPATIKLAGDIDAEAKLDARTHGIPAWEAMGRIWFRRCRKIRRAA